MTGHEEALETAVKKAVITFNEVLAWHGSNLSGAQMGHQFLAMQAAISTYTAKVGGDNGRLAEKARRMARSEGWQYWDAHIPKLFADLAGAIEALAAERNSRPGFGVYTMMKKKLEAAEAGEGEANSLCEALYDEVNSHFGEHVPFTTTMAEVETWLGGSNSKRDQLQARVGVLEAALGEISKGEGRFSMDPLEHASNTIEDMQETARTALSANSPGDGDE